LSYKLCSEIPGGKTRFEEAKRSLRTKKDLYLITQFQKEKA